MKSELFDRYLKDIRPKLMKQLGVKNMMQVPKIKKVCINVGMGSYLQKLGSKNHDYVEENIGLIAGQKPVVRKAKKSVSNFKLREGQPVGVSVTLRDKAAYNFIHKLIHVVYPRVRDFRGVNPRVFDRDGNCSLGFNDHTVFPEVTIPEDSRRIHGVEVTIVTSAQDSEGAKALLDSFGFPFRKPVKKEEDKKEVADTPAAEEAAPVEEETPQESPTEESSDKEASSEPAAEPKEEPPSPPTP